MAHEEHKREPARASTASEQWERQESRAWTLVDIYSDLNSGRDDAKSVLQSAPYKPRIFSLDTYRSFFDAVPPAASVIARSPEVLAFAAAQWVVIVLGYLVWTDVLRLIPDEVWAAVEDAVRRDDHSPAFALCNLVLLAWSFVVVCVVSYPIGICSAAMIAVNDLRASNEEVTFGKCIAIADQHLGRIWAFTIVDSWITVWAILDRLPRKGRNRTAGDELLYYAWKVATLGVVPALVNGRTFVAAAQDSLTLLKAQTVRALGLRFGYSAACWIVGIAAYIGSFYFVHFVERGVPQGAHHIFHIYLLVAVPIAVAVAVVTVLLRPLFLLSVAGLYTDLIDVKKEVEQDVAAMPAIEQQLLSGRVLAFLAISIPLVCGVFFSDQLGVSQWMQRIGHIDVQRYYEHR